MKYCELSNVPSRMRKARFAAGYGCSKLARCSASAAGETSSGAVNSGSLQRIITNAAVKTAPASAARVFKTILNISPPGHTHSHALFDLLHDLHVHRPGIRLGEDDVTVHIHILSIYS